MQTNPARRNYVKTLHLKQVGLALASLWIILLFAAASAAIYREIDGPTLRSALIENLSLASVNSGLSQDLISTQNANDHANIAINKLEDDLNQLKNDLRESRSDRATLEMRLKSYIAFFP